MHRFRSPATPSPRPSLVGHLTDRPIHAAIAHVAAVTAAERAAFAAQVRAGDLEGVVMVETCHRVEVYAPDDLLDEVLGGPLPNGVRRSSGDAVTRHVIDLAVGLESSVVGEDQVLHQLRIALESARTRGRLAPELDRLFDLALRAGRRARTYLPARRQSLADLALTMVARRDPERLGSGGRALVVGAGPMGRLAAIAARDAGLDVDITRRTTGRADALSAALGAGTETFDPGVRIADYAVVVVALRGTWPVASATRRSLLGSPAAVIDLSAPPALDPEFAAALADRLVTIDDVAHGPAATSDDRVRERLLLEAADAHERYARWLERRADREIARTMADLAAAAREAELAELWRRVPNLEQSQRLEIERMASHLAARILQTPLERLGRDVDGRREQAARELFDL